MTRQQKILAGVLAVVLLGAGIGIGIAVAPTTTVTVKPPVTSKLHPHTFNIPLTVNNTCKHDVTNAFGVWLLSVPNGTPGHDNVAKLKKGACYELNGSVWWRGPRNIVLNMNGATIKQETVATETAWPTVGGENNPAVAPYCGSTNFMDGDYTGITTNVLMFSVEGGCDITIENGTIIGRHTGEGTSATYQPDSFLSFYGTQRALVKNMKMTGPYGDYVTTTGLHEAGPTGLYPAINITVKGCSLSNSGRQGVSATGNVHRLTVENNTFTGTLDGTASLIDIEDDAVYPAVSDSDILIQDNAIEGESYDFLLAAETGAELQRVAFNDNVLTGAAQMRIYISPHAFGAVPDPDNNVEIEGNTSGASSTWPDRSPVNVLNVADVLVTGNVDPLPSYGGKGRVFAAFNNPHDLACGDLTNKGKPLDAACPSPLPVIVPPRPAALPS